MEKSNGIPDSVRAELLSDMESLMIHGGMGMGKEDEDNDNYVLANCDPTTHTFCAQANCVAGCACDTPPGHD